MRRALAATAAVALLVAPRQLSAQDGGVAEPDAGVPRSSPEPEPEPAPDAEPEPGDEDTEDIFNVTEDEAAAATPAPEDDDLFTVRALEIAYTDEDVFRTGGSVQRLDEEELLRMPNDDPTALVSRVTGVYTRTEDGFGLRPNIGMRGVTPDRSRKITLMEDGVLFGPAPYAAPAAYYFPLMMRMVGIEVFKGPSSVLYGPNTIGGAINFLTRDVPREPSGAIDLALGRWLTHRAHVYYGGSTDWGGLLFEGVDTGSTGFKELDAGDEDTGFHRTEATLRGYLHTDPGDEIYHRLDVRLGISRERSNETYLGLTDQDLRDDPVRRYAASQLDQMEWLRTTVRADYTLAAGDHTEVVLTGYRHDFDRTWLRLDHFRDGTSFLDVLSNPTGIRQVYYNVLTGASDSASVADPGQDQDDLILFNNARSFVAQGVQLTGRFDLETGPVTHDLEAGVRLHYDEIVRDHTEHGYRMQSMALVSDGRTAEQVADETASALAFAGYATYGFGWRGLRITPGLRVEVISTAFENRLAPTSTSGDQVAVIPGVGATYAILDEVAILAGVHRGFSPVSPGQPAEVQPETSVSWEAGARYFDEASGTKAELIGFYNAYSNIVGTCGGSSGCPPELVDREFNGGAANVFGLEASGEYRVEVGHDIGIPIRVTYTFTRGEFLTAFDSDDPTFGMVVPGDEIPYVPHHQGRLQAGIDHGEQWSLLVAASYVGEMREEAGSGDPGPGELPFTDDYVLLDVSAGYRLFDRLYLYLNGNNLLNQQPIAARRPYGARGIQPISVMGGIRVDL